MWQQQGEADVRQPMVLNNARPDSNGQRDKRFMHSTHLLSLIGAHVGSFGEKHRMDDIFHKLLRRASPMIPADITVEAVADRRYKCCMKLDDLMNPPRPAMSEWGRITQQN